MTTMPNLRPLGDHVIVLPAAVEQVTAHGIVIPEIAQDKSMQGEIMTVGPGQLNDAGVRIPMSVAEGDWVLFAKYAGTEIAMLNVRVLIMREADILAIIEADEEGER